MAPSQRTNSPAPRAPKEVSTAPKPKEGTESPRSIARTPRPYEFGGNLGTAFWTFFIPTAIYYSYGTNVINHGVPGIPDGKFWNSLIWGLPEGVAIRPTAFGFFALAAWIFLQFLFQQFMPGPIDQGTVLKNGRRLPYKLNGWKSWSATWLIVVALVGTGLVDPAIGIFLWVMINWSNVAAMYRGCQLDGSAIVCAASGDWSRVPWAMLIIAVSHTLYICDYFWNEVAILTTTDIRHEPFGFMLLWGDLGFLPWMYTNSFTGYLLWVRPHYEGHWALDAFCLVVCVLAKIGFRLTNIQKHNFRTFASEHGNDPTGFQIWGKDATWIKTAEGSLLLTSGWWGLCRHPNYMPDMIMAVSWFLNCAAHATLPIVPFGYVIYFWSMDIHRFFRDEERCAKKYKGDWDRYVKAVPYRLVPGIF